MTTQKQALNLIRRVGAKVTIRDGEYRVNVPNGTEATAYYTDDARDAVITANEMMIYYNSRKKKGKHFNGMFQD